MVGAMQVDMQVDATPEFEERARREQAVQAATLSRDILIYVTIFNNTSVHNCTGRTIAKNTSAFAICIILNYITIGETCITTIMDVQSTGVELRRII